MNLQKANIFYGKDKLKEAANINRSPTSYLRNPESERKKSDLFKKLNLFWLHWKLISIIRYDSNTDEEIDVLKFQTETGNIKMILKFLSKISSNID